MAAETKLVKCVMARLEASKRGAACVHAEAACHP